MIQITDANFEELVLKTETPALLLFSANWCGACKMVGPIVDMISSEFEGKAIVGKIDVDANPEISSLYGIRNIPALLYFKDGEIVDKVIGAQPKSAIVKRIEALL